jgi:hypothetical protein
MISFRLQRRKHGPAKARFFATCALLATILSSAVLPQALAEDLRKTGTVEISQVQIAFIGSGNLGGGTLYFNGRSYSFTVGGLGIGGFGISKMTATGNVYNLTDPRFFSGAYLQARYGIAIGQASTGEMWLQNANGVVIELKTDREGLAISLGGDAVYINFD